MERLSLTISGKVQGVYYRAHTEAKARELGLTGWVRNNADGTVSLVAEGERDQLEALAEWAKLGSPAANVTDINPAWSDATGEFGNFSVRD